MTFLSPNTHTYIHLPTKLGCNKIDSSTQPSGDTPKIITLSIPGIVGKQDRSLHDLDNKRNT